MFAFAKITLSIAAGVSLLSTASPLLAQPPQDPTYLPHLQAWHFAKKPPLDIEFLQTADHQPRMIITNLHQYPLTAFIVRTDPTAPNKNTLVYDSSARVGLTAPVPRGLSFVIGVPHQVGQPALDPVLAAAVWEDGSTFGPDELLARVPRARTALSNTYDRAIAVLQTGLDKDWTAAEYVAAAQQLILSMDADASAAPGTALLNTTPFRNIKINMERMDKENRPARDVAAMARTLLSLFTQDLEVLRQALGESTPPTGQAKKNP
jgi:hypothetical protein